jgi:hypothetical protein
MTMATASLEQIAITPQSAAATRQESATSIESIEKVRRWTQEDFNRVQVDVYRNPVADAAQPYGY